MADLAVVVVPDVVGGELPVAADGVLLDAVDDLDVALQGELVDAHPADIAEVLRQRRRLRVEGREDEALVAVDLGGADPGPTLRG